MTKVQVPALANKRFCFSTSSFNKETCCCFNLSFLLFLLDRYDYLRITDGSSNTIGTYCGIQTGKRVRVVSTVAVLTFHTDPGVESRGFDLSFLFFLYSPG